MKRLALYSLTVLLMTTAAACVGDDAGLGKDDAGPPVSDDGGPPTGDQDGGPGGDDGDGGDPDAGDPDAPPVEEVAVLVGAGDIASCGSSGDEKTADLLDGIEGTVFTAGDNAYESGTMSEFANCFGPSWGRHRDRIRPSLGNHDVKTSGASGYFDYFGEEAAGPRGKGYYSYDLGKWHIVVLNSNCSWVGGCAAGSEQERWLREDLASNTSKCTLAIWHHARYSSGGHGNSTRMRDMWAALQEHGADVVLTGHDHMYERFAPQDADGNYDPAGIRQFTVGTGGKSYDPVVKLQPNSEAVEGHTFGVLKMTLYPDRYDWEFIPVEGKAFTDSGSDVCN